jgi:hypothetical protein
MKLSKVDAAKTIGVSRQTLYAYIKSSRISVDPDGTIDTAELLRAGFTLHHAGQSEHVEIRHDITPSTVQVDTYREMIELLRQQLADAREREQAAIERERASQEAAREQIAILGAMLKDALAQNGRLLDIPREAVSTAQAQSVTIPGPGRSRAIPETWQQILQHLREHGPQRPQDVALALRMHTARHAVHRMTKAGLLRRLDTGAYEVAL